MGRSLAVVPYDRLLALLVRGLCLVLLALAASRALSFLARLVPALAPWPGIGRPMLYGRLAMVIGDSADLAITVFALLVFVRERACVRWLASKSLLSAATLLIAGLGCGLLLSCLHSTIHGLMHILDNAQFFPMAQQWSTAHGRAQLISTFGKTLAPFVVGLAILFGAPLWARLIIRGHSVHDCPRCGYSIVGLKQTVCPECGTTIVANDAKPTSAPPPSNLPRAVQ